jgi:hypothetical protein
MRLSDYKWYVLVLAAISLVVGVCGFVVWVVELRVLVG